MSACFKNASRSHKCQVLSALRWAQDYSSRAGKDKGFKKACVNLIKRGWYDSVQSTLRDYANTATNQKKISKGSQHLVCVLVQAEEEELAA